MVKAVIFDMFETLVTLFTEHTYFGEDAASDAGVELRQIEQRQQAPDHPILWNVPETDYLKFYLFQIVRN